MAGQHRHLQPQNPAGKALVISFHFTPQLQTPGGFATIAIRDGHNWWRSMRSKS
jgi:hypothetical protein